MLQNAEKGETNSDTVAGESRQGKSKCTCKLGVNCKQGPPRQGSLWKEMGSNEQGRWGEWQYARAEALRP